MTRAVDIEGRGVRVNGRSVGVGVGSAIPDSVVSRPDDTNTATGLSNSIGLVVNRNADYNAIGARISSQTSNATRARLFDYSTESYELSQDISALVAGDTFAFEYEFKSGVNYGVEIDADAGSWDVGFNSTSAYPYIGSDIDIVARSQNGSIDDTSGVAAVNDIGNPDDVLG